MNTKSFTRERVITTEKEVKDIVKLIKYYGLEVIKIGIGTEYRSTKQYVAVNGSFSLSSAMVIELKQTKIIFTTRHYEGKPCSYIFNLNKEETFSNSGHKCFAEFSKYYKVPKAQEYSNSELDKLLDEESGKYVCSASPIIGFNTVYENMDLYNCYEYDLNSAYSSILMSEVPDLTKPIFGRDIKVKKGFVGFLLNDQLTLVEDGYADVVFPLIPSPDKLQDFCKKWFAKKRNSKGVEKLEAKAMLNLPIGYTQRYNPFFRAYVVHKCNKLIRNLIDENTLFWNTDAIFSRVKRKDLPIGLKIGEFKEVQCKVVRYIGNVYQVDDELPVYRGIPKAWFKRFEEINKRPFNILKDDLPMSNNLYNWNWNKLRLENNYETN